MKSFRNYINAFLLVTGTLIFSACGKDVLYGHGDTVTRTRSVGSFNKIEAGGEFEIFLTQGPAADIILEGQENVLADIRTTTRNNRLEIDFRSCRVNIRDRVRVYVTTPNLEEVSISGSNVVRGLTDWKVNDLNLNSSGSGSINLTLLGADEVESRISGSGDIELNGDARRHDLEISGSGKLKAFELATKISEVKISGSGKGDVRVSEDLHASISGSGTVRYKGNPDVNSSISGSGKVYRAD